MGRWGKREMGKEGEEEWGKIFEFRGKGGKGGKMGRKMGRWNGRGKEMGRRGRGGGIFTFLGGGRGEIGRGGEVGGKERRREGIGSSHFQKKEGRDR